MSEQYYSVAERCEILAVELADEDQTERARLLWEAEAQIRYLEVEVANLTRANFTEGGQASEPYLGTGRPCSRNDFRYTD